MVDLARLLGLGLLAGPFLWLWRRGGIAPGWHPLLVLSAATVGVFVSGLLGQLAVGVAMVVLFCAGTLARELLFHPRAARAALREPAYLAFGATVVLLVVLVHGQVLQHYDNFSHWGLVVSVMLENHALPTSDDSVVRFQTYPLGGASLAYLANRTLGTAEWVSMLAHNLLLVSCALPLVSLARRRWPVGVLLYALGAMALLTHITSPTSLLVDSAVAGLGGALLVLWLVRADEAVRYPWLGGVLACALISMKSSGTFFVAIITILAVAQVLTSRRAMSPSVHLQLWSSLAAPWIVWAWWRQHVEATFPRSADSKHSVSVDRFQEVAGEKTRADLNSILDDLGLGIVTDARLWLLLLMILLVVAVMVREGSLSRAERRRLLGVVGMTVLLWELSLAAMYVYSMPLGEALGLAAFPRYQGTVHLVLMLVLLALIARSAALRRSGSPWRPAVLGTAGIAVVLSLVSPGDLQPQRDPGVRDDLEEALAGTTVHQDDTVCVLLEAGDGGYRAWIVRYLLQHRGVTAIVLEPEADALPSPVQEDCDVIVLDDPRAGSRDLLRQSGVPVPTDQGTVVIVP